jgi:hypothetical protein
MECIFTKSFPGQKFFVKVFAEQNSWGKVSGATFFALFQVAQFP